MFRAVLTASFLLIVPVVAAPVAVAQAPSLPAGTPEQRAAMDALDFLDGEWRGEARVGPQGAMTLIQTERVGDLLGGSVKLGEGRGYGPDGATVFNALGVISWSPEDGYAFSTWASGMKAEYPITVTQNGFSWSHPAGPNGSMHYAATIEDGRWVQTGDYRAEGQAPVRVIEMNMTRIGDGDWPGAGAIPPISP